MHPGGGTGYCDRGLCVIAACGDGSIAPSEACEPDIPVTTRCADLGYYTDGPLGCSSFCQLDLDACTGRCGDGVIDPDFELCEGTTPPAGSCIDYGLDYGTLQCRFCAPGFGACGTIGWIVEPTGSPGLTTRGLAAAGGELFVVGDNATTRVAEVLHRDAIGWRVLHQLPFPTSRVLELTDVFAISPTDVWVVGYVAPNTLSPGAFPSPSMLDGVIYHYDGASWTETKVPARAFFRVWASGPSDVFVSGLDRGTDAAPLDASDVRRFDGSTWSVTPLAGRTVGITGAGSGEVYAATDTQIRRYASGTWNPLPLPSGTIRYIHAHAANELYVATTAGVYRWNGTGYSTSLGISFGIYTLPGSPGLAGNPTIGLFAYGSVFGKNRVLRFDGTRWATLTGEISAPVLALGGDDDTVYAAAGGRVYRYGGSAWHRLSKVGPSFAAIELTAASVTQTYVIDQEYKVWWHDPSQEQWTSFWPTSGTEQAVDIWADDNAVFIGTFDGAIHRYDGAWTVATPVTGAGAISDLAGAANDLWASYAGGNTLAHWNGSMWTTTTVPGVTSITSLACRPSGECYGTADPPSIIRTTGAGWTVVDTGIASLPTLDAIDVVPGSDEVWAVGRAGAFVRHQAGAWSRLVDVTSNNLRDVLALAPEDVIATSTDGTAFHFDGTAWAPIRNATIEAKYRVVAGTATQIVFGGTEGAGSFLVDTVERTRPW